MNNKFSAICFLTAALLSFVLGGSTFLESAEKSQGTVHKFAAKTYQASNNLDLGYRLLSPPKLEDGKKYPLVIFLHGAGERGNDNERQLIHVAQELATEEMQQRYPCYVVAPQCPEGKRWVEVDWGDAAHEMPKTPSLPMTATFELIEELQNELSIDKQRIYICGLSMGGFGTWDAIQRKPELFAAAIPICGGGDPAFAEKISDIPTWVFHGDADGAVQVKRSREMVKAVSKIDDDIIYTEYPGVGHNCWAMTAENRLVWDWLFAQVKDED